MTEVTKARASVMGASSFEKRAEAGAKLGMAMGSLLAVAENYPQLKANENFVQLQNELSAIEDKIAYARQAYNDSILGYNNSVETFPGAMFAKMYGHKEKAFLQIPAEEKKVPKVSF
jgi:LemA protein